MISIDVKNKRVFLRVDTNVPIDESKIACEHKLQAVLPTIDYLLKNNAHIILATHIGRPTEFDENLSTKIIGKWFKEHNYDVEYEMDLLKAIERSKQKDYKILLLENLRFFKGERETNNDFAQLLAQLADVYINDAFGLIHRNDTSVTLLPQQFKQKSFGLLVEKELKILSKLKQNPERPFVVVMGGKKSETKLKILEDLVENKQVSKILLGGALSREIESNMSDKIILPVDTVEGFDIGPETIRLFKQEISKAKTIFVNGTMGVYEKKEFETGTREILKAVADSDACSVVGGGDAVAATYKFGLEKRMSFLSTGGGATLAFLANLDLPALAAIR